MNLKFRCWDKENKEMDWVRRLEWDNSFFYIEPEQYSDLFTLEDYDLMPYIGVKDSFGKEIYVSDIVRAESSYEVLYGIVRFGSYNYEYDTDYNQRFYIEWLTRPNYRGDIFWWLSEKSQCTLEVVDNIYENKRGLIKNED